MAEFIQIDHETRTFPLLYKIAKMEIDGLQPDAEVLRCIKALTFTAFAIEAFLNHGGEHEHRLWSSDDRIDVKEKLSIAHAHAGIQEDRSRRPLQSLHDVFEFRNRMAHGRTESLNRETRKIPDSTAAADVRPKAWWEKMCHPARVTRAWHDANQVMRGLHVAGFGPHPAVHGATVSVRTTLPNEQ